MSARKMVPFDEAQRLVLDRAQFLGAETVDLSASLNRILAEDVVSDRDMPPFNKAAMDGYACRRADLGNELAVIEVIPAGRSPAKRVGRNECAKIMTGAMMPEGADCVIMIEFVKLVSEHTVRFAGTGTENNICYRGEDVKQGQIVARKGTRIGPPQIAVMASAGWARPVVARQPRVGIIATGSELVEPDVKAEGPRIRNSNSYQLCAQVLAMGAAAKYHGIAGDTTDALEARLRSARAQSDVLIVSGGVSVGDLDLVRAVLEKTGFKLLFEKVAVKPGMPTVFAVSEEAFCFGLPGNPVSTFVIFEILVKTFLFKLMGHDYRPLLIPLRLEKTYSRKKPERDAWVPVKRVSPNGIVAVEYHGPAHQTALCEADGLICVHDGVAEIPEGTVVDVRPI